MNTNRYIVQQRDGVWGVLDVPTNHWIAAPSFQEALTTVYTLNHDPANA